MLLSSPYGDHFSPTRWWTSHCWQWGKCLRCKPLGHHGSLTGSETVLPFLWKHSLKPQESPGKLPQCSLRSWEPPLASGKWGRGEFAGKRWWYPAVGHLCWPLSWGMGLRRSTTVSPVKMKDELKISQPFVTIFWVSENSCLSQWIGDIPWEMVAIRTGLICSHFQLT